MYCKSTNSKPFSLITFLSCEVVALLVLKSCSLSGQIMYFLLDSSVVKSSTKYTNVLEFKDSYPIKFLVK